MVLQHLVSWLQNAQSVNIRSVSLTKTEQSVPLKSSLENPQVKSPSDEAQKLQVKRPGDEAQKLQVKSPGEEAQKPHMKRPSWAVVFLGTLCCVSLLSSVILSILYGKALRCDLNPEVSKKILRCRNLTDQLRGISEAQSGLQKSFRNLTELNQRLEVQCDELASNNTQLISINYNLSLGASHHEEIVYNLTETNQQLSEDNGKLIILKGVFEEERDNMSAAIVVLQRQNDNLTDLHLQELERRQALFSLNTNLSRELRESAENNTLLWAQSQELLEQNALRNSENLELREAAELVRSQKEECEREVQNLTETQESAIQFQIQNFRREVAELRNSSQHLQGELSSLDLYCPVVNQTTQERRCRSCEEGWNLFRSKCYFFSRDSNSWAHGRNQCLSQGADLLVVDSQEEQRFVFGMSWRLHPEDRAWVGMTDAETEGEWRWVDGSLVTDNVQYWVQRADGSSEPDDWRVSDEQGEDCGHIDTVETELSCWMDAPCHVNIRWICEKAL